MSLEALTWNETRARIRADRARLRAVIGAQTGESNPSLTLHPASLCVTLYRISNHFFRSGHRQLARLFWQLNVMLTGADISPRSDLGKGLVILGPAGVALSADAGRNLTIMPLAGIGSEIDRDSDIGAGPGLPVLGDDVILEPLAGILGPVRIGHRVRITGSTFVADDVANDSRVEGPRPRFLRRTDLP
jgi:serine O-acetyltransferase